MHTFERNADGTLVVMSPTGYISGNREIKAGAYLLVWVESNNLGEVFSSSCGFKLNNGAIRSPDAAFIDKDNLPEDWDNKPEDWDNKEDGFPNLAPDFVIEIRSKSDSLDMLKDKMTSDPASTKGARECARMQEYIENGVKLGWLIDRQNKQALVYRQDGSITQYPANATLSGEDIVKGFQLKLQSLL
jgi:Uma2 family endonuclease